MCKTGKTQFTKKDAQTFVNSHRELGYLRIYPCNLCTNWHITHQPENNHDKKRKKPKLKHKDEFKKYLAA